jgi:excisionase family DNA binding protein
VNARDAAKQLEITLATVYALCRSGDLGHMRVGVGGRTIRLEQSDVDEYKRRARDRAVPHDAEEDEEDPILMRVTLPPREDRRRRPSSPASAGGLACP